MSTRSEWSERTLFLNQAWNKSKSLSMRLMNQEFKRSEKWMKTYWFKICLFDCEQRLIARKNMKWALIIWFWRNLICVFIISMNEMINWTKADWKQCFTRSVSRSLNKTLSTELYMHVFAWILTLNLYFISIMSNIFCSTIQHSFITLIWMCLNIWKMNIKATLF